MCGISIIINKKNQQVEAGEIKKMNDLVAHRGPDDEGFYIENNIAFGHRRLSIIDLSSDGHQPFIEGDLVITYNGEIYNYIEIREELMRIGYTFRTKTDIEVILLAYRAWGKDCVRKFNGMWAFAIHDKQQNIILFSRDRFGVKPLYYGEVEGKMVFGSEIKQILSFLPKRLVNVPILLDKLVSHFENHTNETFFQGVHCLEASHHLIYDLRTHQYKKERYYELQVDKSKTKMDEEQATVFYKDLFEDAVKLRLRSDVKVGTCLSGGLDSSSVAAVGAEIYESQTGSQFTAIHAKASEAKKDESHYAKVVTEHCHLNLHVVEPTLDDFIKLIDEVIYTQEEPFVSPSMFMGYSVFKKARELKCTVMLNGQGGDEVLLGYERYYVSYLYSLPFFTMLKEIVRISKNSKLSLMDVLKYLVYFLNPSVRIQKLKRNKLIKDKYINSYSFEQVRKSAKSFLKVLDMQMLEINSLQLPHLLRYEDRNSMRNSIETRLPFLDYRVVEASLSINNNLKIKDGWTKYILRKAIEKKVPEEIAWRKNKLGFDAPAQTWLDGHQEEILKSIRASKILNEITNMDRIVKEFNSLIPKDKWNLFCVAKWEQVYQVEINME